MECRWKNKFQNAVKRALTLEKVNKNSATAASALMQEMSSKLLEMEQDKRKKQKIDKFHQSIKQNMLNKLAT